MCAAYVSTYFVAVYVYD